MEAGNIARLSFDEALAKKGSSAYSAIPVQSLQEEGNELFIYFQKDLPLDATTTVRGRIKDERGNSCNFTLELWGKNENPATLLITECSTKGTKTQPDRVELLCTKAGSMSGLTVATGPAGFESDRCILPDLFLWQGERIIIQFQSGNTLETYHSNLDGLSANNGCVVILTDPSPSSKIMDALVYSDRASSAYDGWGTQETREAIERVFALGGWDGSFPIHAVDSTYTTSTRTMQRKEGVDTNSASDWIIAPTGGATWGY